MSDRPYFREFTVAQGNPLVVPEDTEAVVFAIGFPQNGRIVSFSIRQVGGSDVAAQCNLFRNEPPEFEDRDDPTDPAHGARALIRIVPTDQLAVTSGTPLERRWDGYYYMNSDGTTSVPVRRVYLEIEPNDTSEDTTWEVAIGVIAGVHA